MRQGSSKDPQCACCRGTGHPNAGPDESFLKASCGTNAIGASTIGLGPLDTSQHFLRRARACACRSKSFPLGVPVSKNFTNEQKRKRKLPVTGHPAIRDQSRYPLSLLTSCWIISHLIYGRYTRRLSCPTFYLVPAVSCTLRRSVHIILNHRSTWYPYRYMVDGPWWASGIYRVLGTLSPGSTHPLPTNQP